VNTGQPQKQVQCDAWTFISVTVVSHPPISPNTTMHSDSGDLCCLWTSDFLFFSLGEVCGANPMSVKSKIIMQPAFSEASYIVTLHFMFINTYGFPSTLNGSQSTSLYIINKIYLLYLSIQYTSRLLIIITCTVYFFIISVVTCWIIGSSQQQLKFLFHTEIFSEFVLQKCSSPSWSSRLLDSPPTKCCFQSSQFDQRSMIFMIVVIFTQ
jgi:hypothetical protein